jgi:hypothetical protein
LGVRRLHAIDAPSASLSRSLALLGGVSAVRARRVREAVVAALVFLFEGVLGRRAWLGILIFFLSCV